MLKTLWQFIFNFLLWIDLGLNFILLGDPSETVSSRTGRAIRSGRPKLVAIVFQKVIDWIFKVLFDQDNHSVNYIEHDEIFKHEIWSWIKE